jgi:capsular exopolysaccharide synthesis family protein
MGTNSSLAVIARRKWTILATVIVAMLSAVGASQLVDDVYSTESTLLVALRSDTQSFDTVQASQAIARSYTDIIDSPNIAEQVARELGGGTTAQEVEDAMIFEAIPETQLVKIRAEAPTGERAKEIADAYAQVFIQYAQDNLAETTQATTTLADSAPIPSAPARPRPRLYVAVAGILGLALGLGLAFLRERLDRRLRTLEDVETQFDVPVLARIPRRGRSQYSQTAFQEASRLLRTNLQFASPEGRPRSIAVTSAREGEGKTTIAASLAAASAEVGLSVLAVEADMRRPGLQRMLMPGTPEPIYPGLSNYLVEASTLEDSIFPTERTGIRIMPAGPIPPSPSALLESRRARTAIEQFASEADLTIVDCPPLNIGADASVIADRVDGVIMVVDLQVSTENSVRQALRQLEAVRAQLLGIVVNRDKDATPSTYDYYYATPPSADVPGDEQAEREKLTS